MTYQVNDEPITKEKRGRKTIYPFYDLDVGQSFFVKDAKAQSARMAASHFARRHPEYKFTTRQATGGIKVWRVKPNE